MKKAIIASVVTIAATTILFAMTSTGVFAREVTDPDKQEHFATDATILKIAYPSDATRADIDLFKSSVLAAISENTPAACAKAMVDKINGIEHGSLYTMTVKNDATGERREFRVNVTKTHITGDCKDVK